VLQPDADPAVTGPVPDAAVPDGVELLHGPSPDPVVLVPPDPAWAERFASIRADLLAALGPAAVRVDHIGSTSVPGLPAKPIVDVQISVPSVDDEGAYRGAVEGLGWVLWVREPGHRMFRDPPGSPATAHLHVCDAGGPWERRHLLFAAFLRAHPVHADSYLHHKDELRIRVGSRGMLAYADAKSSFVEAVLVDAERWAGARGWRP
jgi:GrpB-like predicted nucleotidyltransferase (UPF0157 family)